MSTYFLPTQPSTPAQVVAARDTLQARFDPRHSLYIQTVCDLSRNKYETLDKATFCTYDLETDKYSTIPIWVNPFNEKDMVLAPRFAGRRSYEKERNALYDGCDVLVSADGTMVERDAEVTAAYMYSKYHKAMRDDYTLARPGHTLILFDVTGGFRSKPCNHIEQGSADWKYGRALSRLALEPLAQNEYKESALYHTLRQRTGPSVERSLDTARRSHLQRSSRRLC